MTTVVVFCTLPHCGTLHKLSLPVSRSSPVSVGNNARLAQRAVPDLIECSRNAFQSVSGWKTRCNFRRRQSPDCTSSTRLVSWLRFRTLCCNDYYGVPFLKATEANSLKGAKRWNHFISSKTTTVTLTYALCNNMKHEARIISRLLLIYPYRQVSLVDFGRTRENGEGATKKVIVATYDDARSEFWDRFYVQQCTTCCSKG